MDCLIEKCFGKREYDNDPYSYADNSVNNNNNTNMKNNEKKIIHINCRSDNENSLKPYQAKIDRNNVSVHIYRSYVSDEKISWSVSWPEYVPIEYTTERIVKDKPVWADPADPNEIVNWNSIDGDTDRRSHMGLYEIVNGRPMNPVGRTGVSGRGQLGKWGPNHAADPVVTRWKRDINGNRVKHPQSNKYILQFVSIKRLDTDEWAIPGGMCDPGEKISQTLKREFMEEAIDTLGQNKSAKNEIEEKFKDLFENGLEIYRGYVDDPRNTDNAWMETVAYNFHCVDDSVLRNFELKAGDDAKSVKWMDINEDLKLYANHVEFIRNAAENWNAHWNTN